MASGNVVGVFQQEQPPGTLAALLATRTGGSTPAETWLGRRFHESTVWYMDYRYYLSGYDGGGLTTVYPWSVDGANSGNVILSAAIRAIPDDAEDLDASHSYQYNDVTDAAPSVDGEVVYAEIAFTDGADMDSLADGELFVLRVRRRSDQGGDTINSNSIHLWGPPIVKET